MHKTVLSKENKCRVQCTVDICAVLTVYNMEQNCSSASDTLLYPQAASPPFHGLSILQGILLYLII